MRRLFLSGRRLTSVEQDADSKGGLCFSLEKAHVGLVRLVGEVLAGQKCRMQFRRRVATLQWHVAAPVHGNEFTKIQLQ